MVEMYSTTFEDVEQDALANLMDPKPAWGNVKDCGLGFPCTGPQNVLYYFQNTVWQGVQPAIARSNFQIIHDNAGFAPFISSCQLVSAWNGYFCEKPTLGILRFES